MLFRVYQTAIFIAVVWADIYLGWIGNPYVLAACAFLVAYSLTAGPLHFWDWWQHRHFHRAERKRREAVGMTYGWRRHLPWNANKPG